MFALRQCLAAAMADNRLVLNPAENVPLPSEQLKLPRFLSQAEVDRLADSNARPVPRIGPCRRVRRPSVG